METVALRHLSIGYMVKGKPCIVAEDINAGINAGELTCLLGKNGIGKSTLLRTLSAFQPALSGTVYIDDCDLTSLSSKQLSRKVGVVLTEKPDVRNMSVEEMVGMGRSPYTGFWGSLYDDDRRKIDEAIRLVGIGPLRQRLVYTLSDGERQKCMIAKALAQETPVIYLDEPTAFLDFPSKVEMMQLLRRLAHERQKTIFLSTHDVELALQLADRVWLMELDRLSIDEPRKLAEDGTLGRFIAHPGIHFDADSLTIRVEGSDRLQDERFSKLIDDNAGSDRDVHRVLGAPLRYFQTTVAGIHHLLVNPLHFVAKHHSVAFVAVRNKVLQFGGMFHLFHGKHLIPLLLQCPDSLKSRLVITPVHRFLRTQSRLVNLCGRRCLTNAAKTNGLYTKGVGCTEHATDVVHAPHIVQHHHQRQFLRLLVFLNAQALHLYSTYLSHSCPQNYKEKTTMGNIVENDVDNCVDKSAFIHHFHKAHRRVRISTALCNTFQQLFHTIMTKKDINLLILQRYGGLWISRPVV